MTRSPHNQQARSPRRHAATTSALAAGLFVIALAFIVVFWSEVDEHVISGITTDDDASSVDVVNDATTEPSTVESLPETSSTYIEADVGFPETLNPLLASGSSEESASALLYRSLLSTDESGDPAPDLALDWTISSDGLTYSLELNPDARWHDGEPVTVQDVLFTITLVQSADFPGDRTLSRFWRAITAEQTGEHSLEFTLLEPYIGFLNYLRLPILPEHVFGDVLPEDLDDLPLEDHTVGSGPYQLDAVDPDESELHFSRFEDEDGAGFPELIFRYYEDRDEAIGALSDGEVDGVSYIPLDVLQTDEAIPGDSHVYGPELAGYSGLYFNVRHPYFRDSNTRRAIEAAIDRDAIVESVLGGHAVPGSSPIPRMSSAHQPGNHTEYDPEQARELLERDGWVLEDGEDVRQRDGEHFLVPVIVNSDDSQRVAVANLLQEQLREVGISVDVQTMSSDEVREALESRQFTAAVYGWHTENGVLDAFQLWHSSQGEDGMNFSGFSDPTADQALLQARQSRSIEERNEQYATFQQAFAEQVPAVVLFYPRYHFAVSDWVQGVEPVPLVDPADRVRQIPEWTEQETSAASSDPVDTDGQR